MDEHSFEEPVVVPIEDTLDLHTFRPEEVQNLLDDYLEAALVQEFDEVLIIHGKGNGTLRKRVHSILRKHPLVASIRQGGALQGGWGATAVVLKRK